MLKFISSISVAPIFLLTLCCTNRSSCNPSSQVGYSNAAESYFEDSQEEKVWFERQWKDPKTFVMGKPSDEKIIMWKKICEGENHDRCRFEVESYIQPIESYIAFEDLTWARYQPSGTGIRSDFDYFCWRLNELKPMKRIKGECARYQALEKQLDCVLKYQPGSTVDICNCAGMISDFEMMRADYYCTRLSELFPTVRTLLEEEKEAFHTYRDAAIKSFEMIVLGEERYWGTITPMASENFARSVAEEFTTGVVPVFLGLADSLHSKRPAIYADVTDKMMDEAYEKYLSSIIVADIYASEGWPVPEEYTADNLRCILRADQSAWKAWMDVRQRVSEALPINARKLYDNCTNNASRAHLIAVLNRYSEHDLCESSFYSHLLRRDCNDEQLINYDFDQSFN